MSQQKEQIIFKSVDEVKAYEKTLSEKNGKKHIIVLFGNDVIDVTDFVDDHPGGPDLITDFAGAQDMKEDYELTGHSSDADETMKGLKIGTIVTAAAAQSSDASSSSKTTATATAASTSATNTTTTTNSNNSQSCSSCSVCYGIGIAAVISIIVGFVLLKKK